VVTALLREAGETEIAGQMQWRHHRTVLAVRVDAGAYRARGDGTRRTVRGGGWIETCEAHRVLRPLLACGGTESRRGRTEGSVRPRFDPSPGAFAMSRRLRRTWHLAGEIPRGLPRRRRACPSAGLDGFRETLAASPQAVNIWTSIRPNYFSRRAMPPPRGGDACVNTLPSSGARRAGHPGKSTEHCRSCPRPFVVHVSTADRGPERGDEALLRSRPGTAPPRFHGEPCHADCSLPVLSIRCGGSVRLLREMPRWQDRHEGENRRDARWRKCHAGKPLPDRARAVADPRRSPDGQRLVHTER